MQDQALVKPMGQWLQAGKRVALATVTETWGSSPRRVGAKLAVTEDMQIIGSVSAGCVDSAVIESALEVIKTGQSRTLRYDVGDDLALSNGLACGGQLQVFVQPYEWRLHQSLDQITKNEIDAEWQIILSGSQFAKQRIITEQNVYYDDLLTDKFYFNETGVSEHEGIRLFVEKITPTTKLIIVGANHIAQTLSQLAKTMHYQVCIIDPRSAFVTHERFPHADELHHLWAHRAFDSGIVSLGGGTALVTLSHDPKIDDPALLAGLEHNLLYIGALGSRRTHLARLERFRQMGISESRFRQIRGPVGLQIASQSPEEIALSILAEIVAVKNGANSQGG